MVRALMLSGWVYVVTMLLTVFTSLFNIALFLLATKTLLVLFLFIILARGLGLETLDNRYMYTVIVLLAILVIALGITIATTAKKLRGRQILFSTLP